MMYNLLRHPSSPITLIQFCVGLDVLAETNNGNTAHCASFEVNLCEYHLLKEVDLSCLVLGIDQE